MLILECARVRERMDKRRRQREGATFETTKSCRKPHRYSLAHKHTHNTQLACVTFDDGGKQFHTEIPKLKVIQMGNFLSVFLSFCWLPFPFSSPLTVLYHLHVERSSFETMFHSSLFPHFTSRISVLIRRFIGYSCILYYTCDDCGVVSLFFFCQCFSITHGIFLIGNWI